MDRDREAAQEQKMAEHDEQQSRDAATEAPPRVDDCDAALSDGAFILASCPNDGIWLRSALHETS